MSGLRRTARVDHDALRRNLAKLTDNPSAHVADLRADAYGHGLLEIARTLDAAGLGGVVVSGEADRTRLAEAGIRMSLLLESPTNTEPAHDPLGPALFGLERDAAPAVDADPALDADLETSATSSTEPVLRLSGEVIAVKPVPAGRGVSYGYTYRTANPSRLALIGLGYADGVPRPASNRAPVLIGGFTGTVSGRIAMDQFVVDLGDEHASVGDEAVLFGSPTRGEPSVLDWAQATGIPAASITAGLGQRIERIHLP